MSSPSSDYIFTNAPMQFGKANYQEVLETIKQRYAHKDLIAIYDWGTPSQPGISDIDILLVWKKSAKQMPLHKRSFMTMGSIERYLLRHPLMHIIEEDFPSLSFIYPNATLRKISGKLLEMKKLGKKERKDVLLCVLSDIIIRHYPRDTLQSCTEKRIHVRDMLLRLNSLKYTFKTLEELGIRQKKEWKEYAKVIQTLRQQWFIDQNKAILVDLVEESVRIMMDIVETSRNLLSTRFSTQRYPSELRFQSQKNHTLFVKKWNKDVALEEMKKTIQKMGKHVSILPMELAPQLVCYANQDGRISKHIKHHLWPMPNKKENDRILSKRIHILNSQAELAAKLKHSDFPAFFDFGYRNPTGMNNMALKVWDKIKS